ncbi:MAG: hypothetical protein M0R80_09750 [Proteobacteria bacterium]|jgi:hypothetical protein|nr:hypothetical protein [Pseudomonadota bacterium]
MIETITCGICGETVGTDHYGGKINGVLVDFLNKDTASIRLPICDQCMLKIYYGCEARKTIERNSDIDLGWFK